MEGLASKIDLGAESMRYDHDRRAATRRRERLLG